LVNFPVRLYELRLASTELSQDNGNGFFVQEPLNGVIAVFAEAAHNICVLGFQMLSILYWPQPAIKVIVGLAQQIDVLKSANRVSPPVEEPLNTLGNLLAVSEASKETGHAIPP